ncbi:unnamed protein product [Schistosoma mansoni]|uniref:Smp_205010 n=1 Tax=Schistosoma mansoni TaxID=6183 RepID=UPI00022C82F5|nr:unnamed protein product [Schistosoma mansoni]|eukprot:XP_018647231.1 unnamed protein product [Schistosoma mansoni]
MAYLRFIRHVPKSLQAGATTKHLLHTGNQVNILQSFKGINKQPNPSLLKLLISGVRNLICVFEKRFLLIFPCVGVKYPPLHREILFNCFFQ